MAISVIVGFMTSQIIEDGLSGFKMGLREYRSELFHQKYDGRPNAVFSGEGGIKKIHDKISIGQAKHVYRDEKIVLNDDEKEGVQNIELPLVQIEDFKSEYFAVIESLDDIAHLVNQARQDLVSSVPAGAVRADDQTDQQLDYLHDIQLEIGAIYGWRVATTAMIRMSYLSAYNRDKFDKYFRTWLGYQVGILGKSIAHHSQATKYYLLDDNIKKIRKKYTDILLSFILVLKKQFPEDIPE